VGSYGLTSRGTSAGGATEFLGQSDFENYRIGIEFNTAFLKRAERARYHRAEFTQSQAEKSIANLEQSLAAEIRQAVVEVDRQWQRIEATREAVQSPHRAVPRGRRPLRGREDDESGHVNRSA